MRDTITTGRFADRIALVTGAGTGIGRATAVRLSAEGAHLVLVGRTEATLQETASQIDGSSTVIVGDVGSDSDNKRLFERVESDHGRLDTLVNNAASYFRSSAEELPTDDLRKMHETNFIGQIDLTRRLLPLLRQGDPSGCVINIASTAALSPVPGNLAYASAKAALIYATGVLAAEWGPHVRVNCVCPGFIDTPIHRGRGMSEPQVREFLNALGERHPMRRIGQPEDIAAAVAYLASDDAAWVTGSTLVVDGGFAVAGG